MELSEVKWAGVKKGKPVARATFEENNMGNPSKANLNEGPMHTGSCTFHVDFSRLEYENGSVDMVCIQDNCLEMIPEKEFLKLRSSRRVDPLLCVDRQRG